MTQFVGVVGGGEGEGGEIKVGEGGMGGGGEGECAAGEGGRGGWGAIRGKFDRGV